MVVIPKGVGQPPLPTRETTSKTHGVGLCYTARHDQGHTRQTANPDDPALCAPRRPAAAGGTQGSSTATLDSGSSAVPLDSSRSVCVDGADRSQAGKVVDSGAHALLLLVGGVIDYRYAHLETRGRRAWALSRSLSLDGALYVVLLTGDRRLARAPGAVRGDLVTDTRDTRGVDATNRRRPPVTSGTDMTDVTGVTDGQNGAG